MTAEQERYFKSFLDHMFDHIMDLEERALHHVGADDLSVRELHVLDAVGERMADGRNTMTGIADGLSIQVSSLTVAGEHSGAEGIPGPGEGEPDRR